MPPGPPQHLPAPSPAPGALADLLAARRDVLVERWAARVRSGLGERLRRPELIDSMPDFLRALERALRQPARRREPGGRSEAAPIAQSHGAQRERAGLDLEQVVREYSVLREEILDELEAAALAPTPAEVRTLTDVLADGIAESVRRFVREREERLQEESARLRESLERLEQARRFEEQLFGIASHDLRNPLQAVMLAAHALALHEGPAAPHAAAAARILSAARRASRIVADLLDLTQARLGGSIPIHPRPADLGEIAEEVAAELRSAYPGRAVEVTREGDTRGHWDPDRLAQVVANLAGNALQYGAAALPVQVGVRGEGAEVVLEVRNAGEPIPPAEVPRLFEPLQRGAEAQDSARRSVGLGLFIVRQLVAAHGGAVQVASRAGAGTTFSVRLPRAAPPGAGGAPSR